MSPTENFLESTLLLYRYYKKLGEGALRQLSEEELKRAPDPESNSIAVIVKHLHGNMRSRFTDFLTSDGEKPWRERDDEFVHSLDTREEILQAWEEGWQGVFDALETLKAEDVEKIVYIRNQGHTVLEALQRQLGHYAYHVGQMVFWAKHLKGADWKPLSVPKGKSNDYNAETFGPGRRREHFTK
jgi:uncharacterized damage-inducible protein DinB